VYHLTLRRMKTTRFITTFGLFLAVQVICVPETYPINKESSQPHTSRYTPVHKWLMIGWVLAGLVLSIGKRCAKDRLRWTHDCCPRCFCIIKLSPIASHFSDISHITLCLAGWLSLILATLLVRRIYLDPGYFTYF